MFRGCAAGADGAGATTTARRGKNGEETPRDPVDENPFLLWFSTGGGTIRSRDLLSRGGGLVKPWTNFAQGMLEIDRPRTDDTDRKARHA